MFSGALAGALKFGVVAVTAAGLGGSVYFIAQVGDADDATSRLQAPATAVQTPGQPSTPPPNTPPIPTPLDTPSTDTPATLDTSEWPTYSSPLGFTIKYPPGWEVREQEPPQLSPADQQMVDGGLIPLPATGAAKIVNEKWQDVAALVDGPTEILDSGLAWMEIGPGLLPEFDSAALLEACGANEPQEPGHSNTVTTATFAGLPAVQCIGDHTRPGAGRIVGNGYDIGLPSGRVIGITAYAVDGVPETFQLLEAMLASVSFEARP